MDIHQAAAKGTLTSSALKNYLDNIDDESPKTGLTPLAAAARGGHTTTVKVLLEGGADVNKKTRDGRTPLFIAVNARKNRSQVVQLLLERKEIKVDDTSDDWNNETPLMVAITQSRDPQVIKLLIQAGADLHKPNSRGETAQVLAEQSSNPRIRNAVLPEEQQVKGRLEAVTLIVNFILFILSYVNSGYITGIVAGVVSSLYGIVGTLQPNKDIVKEIANPQTPDEFKTNVTAYVDKYDLGQFFAPDNPFLEKVAEKAVDLKNDPNNLLSSPDQISGLTQLALYQTIFYCDDSGSMQQDNRMDAMRNVVKRLASIATRLVPDNKGSHLRFINRSETGLDDLSADIIVKKMDFTPQGGTAIGKHLRAKILKPFIYDVLDRGDLLERPFLISVTTDGYPGGDGEEDDTFIKAVIECSQRLEQRGYNPEAVVFLVSQVGNDEHAGKFLDSLETDLAVKRVLHRTAERLDERFEDLRKNERHMEEWLFGILLAPITERNIN